MAFAPMNCVDIGKRPLVQFHMGLHKVMLYICFVRWSTKYLVFQFTGWGLFTLLNIYISYITSEFSTTIIWLNILLFLFGIGITHIYRSIISAFHWTTLPTEKLTIRVFLAMIMMGLIYTGFYYLTLNLAFHKPSSSFTLSAFGGSFFSVLILFGLWNGIYFAWNYIETNRRNLIDKLKMESTMKDLEIKTLRANLQPHFIFNALNSIRALIDEDPELARRAITQISNILRSSISKQEATDSLENEMKLVNDYLALEKIRFEERLQVSQDIDPKSLDLQIPTMMLQTLVENAIKHGISSLEAGGHIQLSTQMNDDVLHIQIRNTGQLDSSASHADSLGFGLKATAQRLQWLYGNEASIQLSQENKLVLAHIIIPLKHTI